MTALAAARELRSFLRRHGCRTAGAASAALDGLRAIVPADCTALSVWDPARGAHRTLASSYPAAVDAVIDGRMHTDALFTVVRDGRRPVRVRDLEPRRRHGEIFETIIIPQGFRDGLTQCLHTADGRYVGMLNASTLDARHPDDDTVELLDLLGADLAAALDPVMLSHPPSGALGHGADGLLVGHDGRVVPLSATARPELVALLPRPLVAGRHVVVAGDAVLAVELTPAATGTVVRHREIPPPAGLTVRELEVLDGVGHGLSNPEIGRRLGISPRTVATHVEHLLAKTGARNRVAAARRAAEWGLRTHAR